MLGASESKPAMKPPRTCSPARWIRFTSLIRSRPEFRRWLHSKSAPVSGGGLDADQYGVESRLVHHTHQLRVIREVDRGRLGSVAVRLRRVYAELSRRGTAHDHP